MIEALVRTSLVLAAGLALRGALASRSAALRHAIGAAAILGAVLVVPASRVVPAWAIAVPTRGLPASAPVTTTAVRAGAPQLSSVPAKPSAPARDVPVLLFLWSAGAIAVLAHLTAGIARLSRIAARARSVTDRRWHDTLRRVAASLGLRRRVVLLESDGPVWLATWGLRPARILLPPEARHWTDARIDAVLCHELAHVARADWLVHLAVHVSLAALWFNPLAWIAVRQLRRDSELACDDVVLGRGVPPADYAGHLVAVARACRRPSWASTPALSMARPSVFERRIAAMLNPRLDRRPLSRRAALALAGALIAVGVPAAAARAVQAPPAALSGTVYDPTGAVMPGVTVTLEDAAQHTNTVVTDPAGRFAFPGVGPGQYVLTADMAGFRPLRDEFALTSAADWDRAVTLQLGTLREEIHVSASRGGAPPAPPAQPVRVRVGGNVRVPRKTVDVKPIYPETMRAAGKEAQVRMEAVIGTDGSVASVRVVSEQIHPDFAIAAADAVRQWRFTPTLLNGQPAEVVMTVTVTFSLSN